MIKLAAVSLAGLILFNGCAEFNDPSYPGSYGGSYGGYGSNDPYYGSRRDDYNRHREYERELDRQHEARHDLERERERLEDERRRVEEERERESEMARNRPPPPREDRCPSGFSPSEQKCSPQERKHGCRDVRLPSGLGCVSR